MPKSIICLFVGMRPSVAAAFLALPFSPLYSNVSKKYAKIRTQIQPSKPKREITKITNSQTTKRTYGQLSE